MKRRKKKIMKLCLKEKGFTLLEVLVAAVIGAFIALVAVGSLRAVTKAKEQVNNNIAVADELRFAMKMLSDDLANLYRDGDIENMKLEGTIEATAENPITSLTMYTICTHKARLNQPEGDIYEVQYYLLSEQDKSTLMRRVCPVVGIEEDELTQGGMLTMIAENIAGFEVRYYDGYNWSSVWSLETEGALPELLEVTLVGSESTDTEQGSALMKSFVVNFPRFGEISTEVTGQQVMDTGQGGAQ
jgi:type II secretion system protein J